jgi:hypothetical protein
VLSEAAGYFEHKIGSHHKPALPAKGKTSAGVSTRAGPLF